MYRQRKELTSTRPPTSSHSTLDFVNLIPRNDAGTNPFIETSKSDCVNSSEILEMVVDCEGNTGSSSPLSFFVSPLLVLMLLLPLEQH